MRDRFRCGAVTVLPAEGRLVGARGAEHLRPKAMAVLVALAEREGEVVGKGELLAEVWGEASVTEAVLTNAVTELRRALAAAGAKRQLVTTVPRRGYRLTAPVVFDEPHPDPARSLAVLPFEDFSAEQPAGPLLAAIEEALVGELARQPSLRVVPRRATARYLPGGATLARAGRELRVGRVVTGSAVRNGSRMRLNAQLVNVGADRVLWSTSLVVALGDPVDLPAQIARLLGQELARALDLPAPPARPAASPLDPRSSELFLRGQLRLRGSTVESLEQGFADLDEVARRLPELAAAHAGRARALFLLASWSADPGGGRLARAEAAAARALEIDADSTEAQVWWTMTRAFGHWRLDDALWPLARSVRDHPHNPEARDALAHCLAALGRTSEAIAEGRRALADDPLSPALRAGLGFFLRCAGNLDEAARVLEEALELHPDWTIARLELGTRALGWRGAGAGGGGDRPRRARVGAIPGGDRGRPETRGHPQPRRLARDPGQRPLLARRARDVGGRARARARRPRARLRAAPAPARLRRRRPDLLAAPRHAPLPPPPRPHGIPGTGSRDRLTTARQPRATRPLADSRGGPPWTIEWTTRCRCSRGPRPCCEPCSRTCQAPGPTPSRGPAPGARSTSSGT